MFLPPTTRFLRVPLSLRRLVLSQQQLLSTSTAPPSQSQTLTASPLSLVKYIQEVRPTLQPPVANRMIYNEQLQVMVVGGPNQRKVLAVPPWHARSLRSYMPSYSLLFLSLSFLLYRRISTLTKVKRSSCSWRGAWSWRSWSVDRWFVID